ncbi:hypothetical protein [Halostagnicola sp. A56]|uniref:hypothetical protein n=1 Tax=Halostagnicola sp. A56 TaxID=1495067 RepID=UPI0012E22473|nr:hypothetical protein [Halostagnicola sp. A56]
MVNRIDVKQEILNYILHGEEPSKDVSRTICTGYESQRLYNLPEDYSIEDEVGIGDFVETTSEESIQDDSDEWWEAGDLTFDDLRSRKHTADGDGLSQKQREERVTALVTAIQNHDDDFAKSEIKTKIENIYSVKSDVTLDAYIDDIGDGVEFAPEYEANIDAFLWNDNLDKFDIDSEIEKAKFFDALFEQFYEQTTENEYRIYSDEEGNKDNRGWLTIREIAIEMGWIDKRELTDERRKNIPKFIKPLLNVDYDYDNAFGTTTFTTDAVIIEEDAEVEGNEEWFQSE